MKKIFVIILVAITYLLSSCNKEKNYDCYFQSISLDGQPFQLFEYNSNYVLERIRLFSTNINIYNINCNYESNRLSSLIYRNNTTNKEVYNVSLIYSASNKINALSYFNDSNADGIANELLSFFIFYRNSNELVDSIQVTNTSFVRLFSVDFDWEQFNVSKITNNDGSYVTYEYDNNSNIYQRNEALFVAMNFLSLERLPMVFSQNNLTKINEYDSFGTLLNTKEFQYVLDDNGKVISITEVGGSVQTINYQCVERSE
ncbi:MAG: hypothetical protein N2167_01110 [Flavobacteriales bacterium]|nr:hypothetical protein [Flavobacteriales bacterium]